MNKVKVDNLLNLSDFNVSVESISDTASLSECVSPATETPPRRISVGQLINISEESQHSSISSFGSDSDPQHKSANFKDRGAQVVNEATDSLDSPMNDEESNHGSVDDSLFNAVFYSCDHEGSGKVKVSELLNYIRVLLSDSDAHKIDQLRNLQSTLDPNNVDPVIESEFFCQKCSLWASQIEQIPSEEKRFNIDNITQSILSSPKVNASRLSCQVIDQSFTNSPLDASLITTGFGGRENFETERSFDIISLTATIASFQEENKGLKKNLQLAEETVQNSLSEKKELNRQLQTVNCKLEDLKKKTELLTEDIKNLEDQREFLVENNKMKEDYVTSVKKELDCRNTDYKDLQKELENVYNSNDILSKKLSESQTLCTVLDEEKSALAKSVQSQNQEIFNLRGKLFVMESDLSNLVHKKTEIETDLIDAKMELAAVKNLETISKEFDEYFDPNQMSINVQDFSISNDITSLSPPDKTPTKSLKPAKSSIHEELCDLIQESILNNPNSDIPLLGHEKTRLSISASELKIADSDIEEDLKNILTTLNGTLNLDESKNNSNIKLKLLIKETIDQVRCLQEKFLQPYEEPAQKVGKLNSPSREKVSKPSISLISVDNKFCVFTMFIFIIFFLIIIWILLNVLIALECSSNSSRCLAATRWIKHCPSKYPTW